MDGESLLMTLLGKLDMELKPHFRYSLMILDKLIRRKKFNDHFGREINTMLILSWYIYKKNYNEQFIY